MIRAQGVEMTVDRARSCTAFVGSRRLAYGAYGTVARAVKEASETGGAEPILVFDDATGRQTDFDLRGTADAVEERYADAAEADGGMGPVGSASSERRGPGRPRLGVVSKEVTLLPRHWAWLGAQSGGASATLRRLVDEARRQERGAGLVRRAQDAAYHFASALAGDLPGFEEATRALYALDAERFDDETAGWPEDIRDHVRRLAQPAFGSAQTVGVHG